MSDSHAVYLTRDQIPAPILADKASRHRRMFHVEVASHLALTAAGAVYKALRLSDGAKVPLLTGRLFDLPPGVAVIQTATEAGVEKAPVIYLRPDDAAPMLRAIRAARDLRAYEQWVLVASRDYPSQSGGQDRYWLARYDFHLSPARYGAKFGLPIGQDYPSRVHWDATYATLQTRGLLSKRGGLTPAGRNAISDVQ